MKSTAAKSRKKPALLFRSLQLLLALLGCLTLTHWWQQTDRQGEELFAQQSSVLMRETLKALAQTAAYLIENDQLEGLKALTQQMASNPYLHDVVVYDANGVRLSESGETEPANLLFAPQHSVVLQPMVQEIYQNKQLLGYIRISLKQDASFGTVASNWHELMTQLMWMCAFAVVIGIMLRSSLQWLSHHLVSNRQLHHAAIDSAEHLPTDSFQQTPLTSPDQTPVPPLKD
jgi:uncharacterized membrane protein affecting hemolysin expression